MEHFEMRDIIQRCIEGDHYALRRFMDCYEARVYRVILGILKNQQDAEELTNEFFFNLPKKLKSFDPDRTRDPKPWLYIAAKRDALKLLKKTKQLKKEHYSPDNIGEDCLKVTEDPEQVYLRKKKLERVESVIEELRKKHKAVRALILRHRDCQSYEIIADILEVEKDSAKAMVAKGAKMVRAKFKEKYPGYLSE